MTGFDDRWDLWCLRDSLSFSLSLSLELLVLLLVDRLSLGISSMSTKSASRSLEGMVSVLWSHLVRSRMVSVVGKEGGGLRAGTGEPLRCVGRRRTRKNGSSLSC